MTRTIISLGMCVATAMAACSDDNPPPPAAPAVTLVASTTKASFARGEAIPIQLVLTNQGTASLTVSPRWDGDVTVARLLRGGKPVAATSSFVRYEFSLYDQLRATRVPLAAGASAVIAGGTSSLRGQTLRTVPYAPADAPPTTNHPLTEPGAYELVLRYQYTAPRDGVADMFVAAVDAPPLRFEIRP